MGDIREHRRVLLLVAAFSGSPDALAWARAQLVAAWGPIALESAAFEFRETHYYASTMGDDLHKQFWAFRELIEPASLPHRKLQTNQWEGECAQHVPATVPRPLNLDPGYLTEAKLVLASTKDRDHRLYLDHGIFAENTLFFHAGQWCRRPWTYPDYQRADYHQFLVRCRDYYRQRLHER
ncbi:MAG: DUF4416 family protein [Pirellulaceae bacterium]|jgi:hypothetical protein|nr:DUF4416 family protein [Pirellulaceae bacterium]